MKEQGPRVPQSEKRIADEQKKLEDAIVGIQTEARGHWQEFLKVQASRRDAFLQQLVAINENPRTEDFIRGQITELSFFIHVDALAKEIAHGREREARGEARPDPTRQTI